ncbi:MAG: WbqC family protein [bacterium]|nr:WbqC family protein [bacterium]
MILTAHQPCYLPWIGFFAKAALADAFIFMDWVQLNHQSWQTRNRALSANGPVWLIVPVKAGGRSGQSIRDTEIAGDPTWQRKHWTTIQQCYGSTPYFDEHSRFFEHLYQHDWKKLAQLNIAATEYLFDCFGIKPQIYYGDAFDFTEHKTALLAEMCAAVGTDSYLSSDGERAYVDRALLASAGVEHRYLNYEHPEYEQRYEPFTPYMSALDLLFNCGPDSREIMLSGVGKAKDD